MEFKCFLCHTQFSEIKLICQHLKIIHLLRDNSTNLECAVNSQNKCLKSFHTFKALQKHMKTCITTKKTQLVNDSSESDHVNAVKSSKSDDVLQVKLQQALSLDSTATNNGNVIASMGEVSFEFIPQCVTSIDRTCDEVEENSNPLDSILQIIAAAVGKMNLIERDIDIVYKLCINVVENVNALNEQLIKENNGYNSLQVLQVTTDCLSSTLKQFNTKFKRQKENKLHKFYVEPHLKAIGTRFELKKVESLEIGTIERLQCVYPYISIVETCQRLFQNKYYLDEYLEYNKGGGNGHICKDGEFKDFCCGSIFKKREIFQMQKYCLQIEIFSDDYEVCNPIGSKATIHKVCGVYFRIRNMPGGSELNKINLVALCNSDDLKTLSTDFNNIWRCVVDDLKYLEKTGIDIISAVNSKINLKGTLIAAIADNLGANMSLGLVESFVAHNFCRICELRKEFCKTSCAEVSSEMRTRQRYQNHMDKIQNSTKVDYAETAGIKRYCLLNDLQYFHTMENFCVDIMHDVNEGIIHFLIAKVLKYLINEKIVTENTLIQKFQYYDYGEKQKKNIPSKISLEKSNLNQNAAQSMCLFIHLPFILYEFRCQLEPIWICVKSLQKILQIITSRKISQTDLENLKQNIFDHLYNVQKTFNTNLLPKHHFLTHYPTVIQSMGSVKLLSTMRFEAKHQEFKHFARNIKNFKCFTHTLALKHQRIIARKLESYRGCQNVLCSKKIQANFVHGSELFLIEVKWVEKYSSKYKVGSFILHSDSLFKIERIFVAADDYTFICVEYSFVAFDEFTNSFEILKILPAKFSTIKFSSMTNYDLIEQKTIGEALYVIANNLDVKHAFENAK